MSGAYQSLYDFLRVAPSMTNVDVKFGEETNWDLTYHKPRVVIYPTVGTIAGGVGKPVPSVDVNVSMLWDLDETLQIHCWAKSDKTLPTILDHYSACETLRQKVLQAFRYQRYHFTPDTGPGLYVDITPGKTFWILDDSRIKQGRAFVIELALKISIPDVLPVEAEIDSIDIEQVINN